MNYSVLRLGVAALALVASSGVLMAQTAPAPLPADKAATIFGARDAVSGVSLSPDGKLVAIVAAMPGRQSAVLIGDLVAGGAPKAILTSSGNPDRLSHCDWMSNTRLVCGIYMIAAVDSRIFGSTRLLAVDSDGKNVKPLSQRESNRAIGVALGGGDVIDLTGNGDGRSVLMTSYFLQQDTAGTIIQQRPSGLGVELVDTVANTRKLIERGREDAFDYITDGRGTVRIMGTQDTNSVGYNTGELVFSYRKKDSREWLRLGAYNRAARTGLLPVAVDPDLDAVYGFDTHNGRRALFRVSLDGSMRRELVLDRPDVDIDGLIRLGREQRVVGASYATDVRTGVWFDPALKALDNGLRRALGDGSLYFGDTSSDGNKLLIHSSSDVNPGRWYVYDKTTKKLAELIASRPATNGLTLATVKSVTYPAADGTQIPAYLTLPPGSDGKNLPAIVMPHGGPESRDEWGFDWLAQYFAARGYAVLQPNFRGSSGYGDAWFRQNGFKSWRTAVGDVNDGGRWLVSQGIAAPGKLGIFGWSYGGYAALQSAVLDPTLFKAIVAVAPVTDLDQLRREARNTSDYRNVDAFIGNGPHIEEGSPARHASRFVAPVLLFHGDLDVNVDVAESRLMEARLRDANKQVEYFEFKGLDHGLPDSATRAQMLTKADGFLRQSMGIKR